QRRQEAEEQARIVVESSPAPVVVLGEAGTVLMANVAARKLFTLENEPLEGVCIWQYLPVLETVQRRDTSPDFLNVSLEARGRRKNGEPFPASLWVSTYRTRSGSRLAAIILDASDDLR